MMDKKAVDKTQEMQAIIAEITNCHKCALSHSRKHSVPGEGSFNAEIMFIGEGPGFHENEQGLPFVGQAGKFLDELLTTAGLIRDAVFITNVVKCRPPGNRDPQPDELIACKPYLDKQIEIIDPFVIVTLGRFSMANYFPDARISQIHGKSDWQDGRFIVPMYHPAAALHQPKLKPVIQQDFSRLPGMVAQAKQKKNQFMKSENEKSDTDATQLSLL